MSTWEMFKFWFIKETMPLWITLAIILALVVGCIVWGFIESISDKFRKKPNASFTLRGGAKRNPDSGERSCSA